MDTVDTVDLLARVQGLEVQNQRLKRMMGLLLLLVVACFGWLFYLMRTHAAPLRGESLMLGRTKDGQAVVELGFPGKQDGNGLPDEFQGGSGGYLSVMRQVKLALWDQLESNPSDKRPPVIGRVEVVANPLRPGVSVYRPDETGRYDPLDPRIKLGIDTAEARDNKLAFKAALLLSDKAARKRVTLEVMDEGDGLLTFRDAEGHPRLVLGALADGTPVLKIMDAAGETLWVAPESR